MSPIALIGRDERGAALVEAALMLPLFLALVGGVCEFGFFLYQQQMASAGVRDAARYLALTADPKGGIVQGAARNLAVSGYIQGGPPRIADWSTAEVSVSVTPIDNSSDVFGGASPIEVITVSTSFTYASLGFLGLLGLTPPTITVTHQERHVGGSAPG
jgi:TadE-like protein